MVFTIVGCLFVKKIQSIISAIFYEIPCFPVIVKILPKVLFREFVPAFCTGYPKSYSEGRVILKIVPKAGHEYTQEKLANETEGKTEQKFDMAFETVVRIYSKCFQKSKQNFYIYFSL
jgi:hypothetical protein